MAYRRTILPLYYNPGLSPCSRTVWFLTGFLFVLDFYKSETGQRIVIYIKKLYNNYSDFCSIRNLKELMEREITWQLISCFLTGYSLKTGVTKYFRKHRLTPEDMV
ncbi:hypothetical protein RhiirB3_506233 [Rhizophagus irregularis]|nr:hypothetical protein RhiirB3_506233 [Rhizophagus irregularis]